MSINANIDIFVNAVKKNAPVRGCRWDDIVLKFEYEALTLPALTSQVIGASISQK